MPKRLGVDIPKLMQMISPPKPREDQAPSPSPAAPKLSNPLGGASDDNPFAEEGDDEDYIIRERDKSVYERTFLALGPVGGKLTGAQVKQALMDTGVPTLVLRKVWTLSDIDKDGKLDLEEFAIAMR